MRSRDRLSAILLPQFSAICHEMCLTFNHRRCLGTVELVSTQIKVAGRR